MALERLRWAGRESVAVRLTSFAVETYPPASLLLLDRATNEAVVTLCGRMPALTALDLYGANTLTDEALHAVAELKLLTFLVLRDCELVSDTGVRFLAKLKSLTVLSLDGCSWSRTRACGRC